MTLKNELSANDGEIKKFINRSLELLKSGDFKNALESFLIILKENYNNAVAESGIKCCKYWIPRINKISDLNDQYEIGKLLFIEWTKFEKFTQSIKNIQSKVISNIMFYVFNEALEAFKKDIRKNRILDLDSLYMIALSYKKIGDFQNSIKYFEEALNVEQGNSNSIAQLADCYALIDEEKKSKLLFREAFFLDPASIILEQLDSNIITSLISKVLELGISKKEINHWLPVYGRVFNIFIIFRELIPIEITKLRKEIYYLEKDVKDNIIKDNFLKARLLNLYFWLYDHLNIRQKDKKELLDIESKIEFLSNDIYEIFKNADKMKEKSSY